MDTQPFVDWYTSRRIRVSGRAPSPHTLRTKRSRINQIARTMGAETLESLGNILSSRQAVDGLLDRFAGTISPGSQRIVVDALADFARYCEAMGWPVPPLTKNDRPGPNPPKPIVVYTDAEIERLLLHARPVYGPRWELFLETLVGTGRRISEVLGLEFAWLNTSATPPHFHLPTTKNGQQAYVVLSERLASLWTPQTVQELQTAPPRLIKRDLLTYPFPWTYQVAHRIFTTYCERVGVESRGFHCFRHTKATEMLARGVPIQAVSAILGHASVATTDRIYNHTSALSYAQYVQ